MEKVKSVSEMQHGERIATIRDAHIFRVWLQLSNTYPNQSQDFYLNSVLSIMVEAFKDITRDEVIAITEAYSNDPQYSENINSTIMFLNMAGV